MINVLQACIAKINIDYINKVNLTMSIIHEHDATVTRVIWRLDKHFCSKDIPE